jgi:hypothetical protein
MEGTWQLPSESEETFAKFTELMAQPIKAGPGGEYASELLYDIFGDDTLFDEIGELGDRDPEADVRDLIRARAEELEVVMPEEAVEGVNEDPTQEEPASGYEAGQARGAAGKQRSLEMGMGGQDVVKTAGGSDVEEGIDSFVNPNDQDGTDDANKISNSEQSDLEGEDMTEDNDMKDLLRLAGRGNVNEAKSPPEVINPTKDSSPADLKAAIKYAQYMKAKMDKPVAKKRYDDEIAQLRGWMKAKSVMKETQDIDTGEEVVKAERDPALTNEALERILKLSKW